MSLFPTEPDLKIVSLTPTARDPSRTSIRIGTGRGKGKVAATLSTRLLAQLDLTVGQVWDPALAQRVEESAQFDKAFRAASNRLARRAMSRKMLDDKLRQLEHPQAVRDAVLARLEELGLIDDQAYGQALVRNELARKPAGPRLLSQKLFQKGIRGALADQLIAEATADPDEQYESALAFARKKAANMQRLDTATRQRRLYGQLARRGFDSDTIRAVMPHVVSDDQTPLD